MMRLIIAMRLTIYEAYEVMITKTDYLSQKKLKMFSKSVIIIWK